MKLFIVTGYCCREWPLALGVRIGRCGYCGEVPKVRPGGMN